MIILPLSDAYRVYILGMLKVAAEAFLNVTSIDQGITVANKPLHIKGVV